MKKLFLILALALPFSLQAQLTTNTPENFAQSAMAFFTSFNTNLPANSTFQLWTGTANVNNDRMYAEFGLSFHPSFMSPATNQYFGVDAIFRNDVLLGSLAQVQGGLSYHIIHVDLDLAPQIHFGYDYHNAFAYVAPGLSLSKMLTENTYTRISLELPVNFKGAGQMTPTYGLSVGAKF
jgi:hypothetical protein